jgi:hypothetical protein
VVEKAWSDIVNTRSLFETLGFQKNWEAIADELPAYAYDFGNLYLEAAQVMSMRRYLVPVFLVGGVIQDARSIARVEFEMPLEIESFEQGVAWISYGIGADFQPRIPTPWLDAGPTWENHLPWVRDLRAYERRPKCSVEKDWFRVATKKLRALAAAASESDLAWLAFDGEALRVAVCGATVIVPAAGKAWDTRYAIKGTELDHLPKRLTDPVLVSIWDGKLTIGNRVWTLAQTR